MNQKLTFLSLAGILLASCGQASASSISSLSSNELLEKKNYNIYMNSPTTAYSTVDISYFSSHPNIPYISIQDAMPLYKKLRGDFYHDPDWDYEISSLKDNSQVITNKYSKDTLTFNAEKDSVTSPFLDSFLCENGNLPGAITSSYGTLEKSSSEKIRYIAMKENAAAVESNFVIRKSNQIFLDLNHYDIDLLSYDKNIYLPFATYSDLFLGLLYTPLAVCTDGIYCVTNTSELKEGIAGKGVKDSKELLKFNYNELCFNFDYFYGFAQERFNRDSNTYFTNNGLKESFLSSSKEADKALNETIYSLMDDGHTNFLAGSPNNLNENYIKYGNEGLNLRKTAQYYAQLYKYSNVFGERAYQEYGNTAIIVFTSFSELSNDWYSKGVPATYEEAIKNSDFGALFAYAYSQINRENSPIENVIVDESLNGGGDARNLAFVAAMLAGGEISLYSRNVLSGDISSATVVADCNLDGKYDEEDQQMSDKEVYVLTSPYSFSCANALPSLMKQKPNCHVIGQRSGGGSNVVLMGSTAIGTAFRMSGVTQICTHNNGAYPNVDLGVEVDKEILPEHFYSNNREDLITDLGLAYEPVAK